MARTTLAERKSQEVHAFMDILTQVAQCRNYSEAAASEIESIRSAISEACKEAKRRARAKRYVTTSREL